MNSYEENKNSDVYSQGNGRRPSSIVQPKPSNMFSLSRKSSKQPNQQSRQESVQSGRSGRTFLTGLNNDQGVLNMNPSDIKLFGDRPSLGGADVIPKVADQGTADYSNASDSNQLNSR